MPSGWDRRGGAGGGCRGGGAGVAAGDQVFGFCPGAFAEFARAKAELVVPKPAGLSFEQAAAMPMAGTTALRGIRDVGGVRAGQRVLVNGAGGGVGTFAVQVAAGLGAEVTGVCSAGNAELLRSLGAAHVVDYSVEDFTATRGRYDVVLDNVGNQPLCRLRQSLTSTGTPCSTPAVRPAAWSGRWARCFGRPWSTVSSGSAS